MSRRDLERALKAVGSLAGLAQRLGVTPAIAKRWLKAGVPATPKTKGGVKLRPGDERALEAAVERLGVKPLAKSLGVTVGALRGWIVKGIPIPPAERVARLAHDLRQAKTRSLDEQGTFAELLKRAGEVKKLPEIRTGQGVRSGKATQGYRYTRRIARELKPDGAVLEDILAWTVGLQKRYPLWQIVSVVSLYALDSRIDLDRRDSSGKMYSTVFFDLKHPKAGDFAIDTKVTSFAGTDKASVVDNWESKMWSLLQDGMVKVFVHGVTMFNYRRRSSKERSGRETSRRYLSDQKRKKRERRSELAKARAKAARKKTRSKVRKQKQYRPKKKTKR